MNETTMPLPDKTEGAQRIFFLPSTDRRGSPIDQEGWLTSLLDFLGRTSVVLQRYRKVEACGVTTCGVASSSMTKQWRAIATRIPKPLKNIVPISSNTC